RRGVVNRIVLDEIAVPERQTAERCAVVAFDGEHDVTVRQRLKGVEVLAVREMGLAEGECRATGAGVELGDASCRGRERGAADVRGAARRDADRRRRRDTRGEDEQTWSDAEQAVADAHEGPLAGLEVEQRGRARSMPLGAP